MMKLLSSPASPFVRKVKVMLHEAQGWDQVEEVAVTTTPYNTAPEVRAANPLGKIPALIREDGPALHDSRVITRFLDNKFNANLYPEARLWEVLTLESMSDAIMDAAVLLTYEARFRSGEQQSPEWQEAQWGKITATLNTIETRWMSHLAGPLDMSHIALACALKYLDFRHDTRNWRKGHGALPEWHADIASRESLAATRPAA